MSKKILLADDSVTIRKVVELTFMDEDYHLDSVGSGEQALEKLTEESPDLVIADIHMPGVSGYDVCRRAKEQDSETPVLLLVGTFEPFNPEEVQECGGDRYLKKPFDSQELLKTVSELLTGEPAAPEEFEAPAEEDLSEPEPVAEATADEIVTEEAERPEVDSFALAEMEEESPSEEPVEESAGKSDGALSEESVDRIARRVVELLGDETVKNVAWEVIPDLAEVVIKERLRELEDQVE